MNVWLCQAGETPAFQKGQRKMRTSLLAQELCRRGHNVVWWASAFDHQKKRWRTDEEMQNPSDLAHLKIKYLRGLGYKSNISIRRFLDHRVLASKFKSNAELEPRPDLILASIPTYDMAVQATRLGKIWNIPVVVDVRDQWPEIFIKYLPSFLSPLVRAALAYDFRIFTEAVRTATALNSMMDTILNWALKYADRGRQNQDQVFYLGASAPSQSEEVPEGLVTTLNKIPNHHLKVAFVGTFGNQNNPSIMAEVAALTQDRPISFILGGNGAHYESIKKKTVDFKNFHLLGWLNESEMSYALKHADIAICPTPPNVDVFPNKVFVYFSHGLPVVTSSTGDLADIVTAQNLGALYKAEDIVSLKDVLEKYVSDSKLLESQKIKTKTAFEKEFNAENIYKRYVDYLEQFVVSRK